MTTSNFIDREYLISRTNLQKNVLEVERYIDEATLLYIQPILGLNYHNILYANFVNDRILEGTLEKLVLDYVRLATAYYTVSLILPNIHYKLTETSVVTKDGGDNTSVESRDLQYLITLNKQNGDRFMAKALDILNDNCNMFPYFKVRNPNQQDIRTYGGILFSK